MTTLTLPQRIHRATVAYIVTTIETECLKVMQMDGSAWWDTRHMFNEHEHCNEIIDINAELLSLGLELGVIARHRAPELAHLVHVNASVAHHNTRSTT